MRKWCEKWGTIFNLLVPFWSHFPSKFDEKIDAKIDDEKVMKMDEKSIRKLIYIFIGFETYVHKKTYFSKKANVRKSYESSSKTRVGEGSPKNQKIRKWEKLYKQHPKNETKIGVLKIWKIIKHIIKHEAKNHEKTIKKSMSKFNAKKMRNRLGAEPRPGAPGEVQINKIPVGILQKKNY